MPSITSIAKEKLIRVGNPSEWHGRTFVTAKIFMDKEFSQAVIYFDPYTDSCMVRKIKVMNGSPNEQRSDFWKIKASCFDNITNGVTRSNLYDMGFKEVV